MIDNNAKRYRSLSKHWQKLNIKPHNAKNIIEVLKKIQKKDFHLIILSEQYGSNDILNLIPFIRALTNAPIVIYCEFEPDIMYKEKGYLIGCDQIWKIPDNLQEAIMKGYALIRRYLAYGIKPVANTTLIYGDIALNYEKRLVVVRQKLIILPYKQFLILKMLMTSPGRVYTYSQIFCEIWGYDYIENNKQVLWNQIKLLRKAIKIYNDSPEYIKTVHGFGYSFNPQ